MLQFIGPMIFISIGGIYYALDLVHPFLGYGLIVSIVVVVLWWIFRYGNVTIGLGPQAKQPDLTLPHLKPSERVRFVCISDTHSNHRRLGTLPEGDVLLHAGDFTNKGTIAEVRLFAEWLDKQPFQHKIVIAGNHDRALDKQFHEAPKECRLVEALLARCSYLNNASTTVFGYKVYGRPETPEFHAMAFNVRRGRAMMECWDAIPDDTDILLTHCPPFMVRDRTVLGQHAGCAQLAKSLHTRLNRVKVHVFGHIHEAYGVARSASGHTTFINAAMCNVLHGNNHKPIVFDLPRLKTD